MCEVLKVYIYCIFTRCIKILIANSVLRTTKLPTMFSSGLNCNLSFPSCLGYPQDSEELIPKMAREPIILNVYDMVSSSQCTKIIRITTILNSGLLLLISLIFTNLYIIILMVYEYSYIYNLFQKLDVIVFLKDDEETN